VSGYLVGPNVNLSSANLSGASLVGAQLTGTNFTAARLTDVDFSGASMTNAILSRATLTGSSLHKASLSNAQLDGVVSGSIAGFPASLPPAWRIGNLYLIGPGARLVNANLAGVNLAGANLSGALMFGANLTDVQWSNTTCPNGTVQSTRCPVDFGFNGTARVTAALDKRCNCVRVTVAPGLAKDQWSFGIDRLSDSGGFVRIDNYTTRGGNETRTVTLVDGTYRAVVPSQLDYIGSATPAFRCAGGCEFTT
jgi:hypothetical protein